MRAGWFNLHLISIFNDRPKPFKIFPADIKKSFFFVSRRTGLNFSVLKQIYMEEEIRDSNLNPTAVILKREKKTILFLLV